MLQRDAQTFLQVIEEHKAIIYKVANSYCRNGDSREDLVQEIILQLWLSFARYDGQFKLSTWMYRIALNVSISFYRKEYRRNSINQPLPGEILHLQEDSSPLREEVAKLYRFIRELKEMDRAVMLLYLEGNSQQEIADVLGLTVTNISTKVFRIRQQLKKEFSNLNA